MKSLREVLLLTILCSCSGMQKSEMKNLKEMNAQGEFVLRNHDEEHYKIDTPRQCVRSPYPWEKTTGQKVSK